MYMCTCTCTCITCSALYSSVMWFWYTCTSTCTWYCTLWWLVHSLNEAIEDTLPNHKMKFMRNITCSAVHNFISMSLVTIVQFLGIDITRSSYMYMYYQLSLNKITRTAGKTLNWGVLLFQISFKWGRITILMRTLTDYCTCTCIMIIIMYTHVHVYNHVYIIACTCT